MKNRIFSTDSPKATKSLEYGYLNAIHYLAPATFAGVGDVCVNRSPICTILCLGLTSGQAGMVKHDTDMNSVRQSRVDKTVRFMRDRKAYLVDIVRSIELVQRKAERLGLRLCVRMNGSSDIAWEGIAVWRDGKPFRNLMLAFPDVDFVDYTKIAARFKRKLPANYHLTLSRSEINEPQCLEALANGINVAVVFAGNKPSTWNGFDVIDGDLHDLRQLDPRGEPGVVIGLSPKGSKAKRDMSGFVIRNAA